MHYLGTCVAVFVQALPRNFSLALHLDAACHRQLECLIINSFTNRVSMNAKLSITVLTPLLPDCERIS